MASNYGSKYCVDIVMCIDATGSMGSLINTVKAHALSFYADLIKAAAAKGKVIYDVRVKVIVFRDYVADGENAMLATNFFNLPEQNEEFRNCVSGIEPFGGGDEPEDGLEALAYAIKSKWTKESAKRRHIIIVWSDDATHPLGFGSEAPNYPQRMAQDFDELTEWWGDPSMPGLMDNSAKRLLIYAPDKPYWSTISNTWDNVIHFPSEAGNGLEGLEYKEILDAILSSI